MADKKLNEEQKTLVREMVLWLARKYYRWSRNGGSALNDLMSQSLTPATEEELAALFSKAEVDISGLKKFLFLAPLGADNSVLPVATISCNFRRKVPEIRVQLGLFAEGQEKPRAIGLRFETPEGKGPHNYYHCQFITDYRTQAGGVPLPHNGWLPTKDPTLLLGAKNCVALMVCLIASLYGREEVDSLVFEPFGNQLKRYMGLIPWEESKALGKLHQEDDEGRWHCQV
jgi:hypothetical protein